MENLNRPYTPNCNFSFKNPTARLLILLARQSHIETIEMYFISRLIITASHLVIAMSQAVASIIQKNNEPLAVEQSAVFDFLTADMGSNGIILIQER